MDKNIPWNSYSGKKILENILENIKLEYTIQNPSNCIVLYCINKIKVNPRVLAKMSKFKFTRRLTYHPRY